MDFDEPSQQREAILSLRVSCRGKLFNDFKEILFFSQGKNMIHKSYGLLSSWNVVQNYILLTRWVVFFSFLSTPEGCCHEINLLPKCLRPRHEGSRGQTQTHGLGKRMTIQILMTALCWHRGRWGERHRSFEGEQEDKWKRVVWRREIF